MCYVRVRRRFSRFGFDRTPKRDLGDPYPLVNFCNFNSSKRRARVDVKQYARVRISVEVGIMPGARFRPTVNNTTQKKQNLFTERTFGQLYDSVCVVRSETTQRTDDIYADVITRVKNRNNV